MLPLGSSIPGRLSLSCLFLVLLLLEDTSRAEASSCHPMRSNERLPMNPDLLVVHAREPKG